MRLNASAQNINFDKNVFVEMIAKALFYNETVPERRKEQV